MGAPLESRFVDRVEIRVAAGKGGDGLVAFRREAFVPKGGPSGGNGGRGGSVILAVRRSLSTLIDFRGGAVFKAGNGAPGGANRMTGRDGADLVLSVPPGTVVTDADSGTQIGDLTEDGQTLVVAEGGAPGRGNARFATPTRQTPRFATPGGKGVERRLILDLKLIADAGLVGLPNAGKSTLLASVSRAKPRIGNYPFTTLHPCLGVVRMGDESDFVIADLPGLIEGASEGAGLGLRFLRHVERTAVLVYVLAPDLPVSPAEQLRILKSEIAAYGGTRRDREILVLSKADLLTPDDIADKLEGVPGDVIVLSSATGEGVARFLKSLAGIVAGMRMSESSSNSPSSRESEEPV